MIKILYLIYQICFALPVMIAVTILVALTTMIGSVFNDRFGAVSFTPYSSYLSVLKDVRIS